MARQSVPTTLDSTITALLEAEAHAEAQRRAKPIRSVINDTAEAFATSASIITDIALLAKSELTMLRHEQKLEQVARLQELYPTVEGASNAN